MICEELKSTKSIDATIKVYWTANMHTEGLSVAKLSSFPRSYVID